MGVNIQEVLFIIHLSKAGLLNREPAAIRTCDSSPTYRHNKRGLYYIFHPRCCTAYSHQCGLFDCGLLPSEMWIRDNDRCSV